MSEYIENKLLEIFTRLYLPRIHLGIPHAKNELFGMTSHGAARR